jgi:glycosyltransferase involved in cell wall biosynthesis
VPLAADATDLLFIGELRMLKGVDTLIAALALLREQGRRVTLTLVGAGSDRPHFEADVARLGLNDRIQFVGAMPARKAFALGRIVLVPSRAESLPYILLEAAAAGKPVIATHVGGIPEIFGSLSARLIPPDHPQALAEAIARNLDQPQDADAAAAALRTNVGNSFTIERMVDGVLAAYAEVLRARRPSAAAS